jgi:hypothetical protein
MCGPRAASASWLCALGVMSGGCGQSFQAGTGSGGSAGTISNGGSAPGCADQTGCVEEFVGAYHQTGTTDGAGTAARFTQITGITGDGDDTLWVTDARTVRSIIISTREVSTLAGTFGELRGIVYVASSPPMLLVADATHVVVRKVDPSNPANTAVFSGTLDTPGSTDGNATTYTNPGALAWVTGSGRYFVLDGNSVRYFFNSGSASTVAVGSPAVLNSPAGILAEPTPSDSGATYTVVVGETGGNDIVSFNAPSGAVTPWAAGPSCGGVPGYQDGACASARFEGIQGLAWRDTATFFVADTANHRVREVSWSAEVDTVAGDGVAGHSVGILQAAQIDAPTAVFFRARAGSAELFIVDADGTEIRKQSLP